MRAVLLLSCLSIDSGHEETKEELWQFTAWDSTLTRGSHNILVLTLGERGSKTCNCTPHVHLCWKLKTEDSMLRSRPEAGAPAELAPVRGLA